MGKPRKPIFDGVDPRQRTSLIAQGDFSYEKRLGGSGDGSAAGGGGRRVSGSAPQMRPRQTMKLAICLPHVIAIATLLQDRMDELERGRTGRRHECGAMDAIAFWLAIHVFEFSLSRTELELQSKSFWRKLRKTQLKARPGLDTRLLLSKIPPSEWQYRRFRDNCLDDETERTLIAIVNEAALRQAAHCEMLTKKRQGKSSTTTEPHRTQVVAGDSTELPALYRGRPGQTRTSTGKPRRYDPDAIVVGKKRQPFYNIIFGTIRSDDPGERVVLLAETVPQGTREAVAFSRRIVELRKRHKKLLRGLAVVAFDMDMRHEECDLLLSEGILPVCKVSRTNKGQAAGIQLGKHPFKKGVRVVARLDVTAIDGTPTIAAHDSHGNLYDQPLKLAKHQKKVSKKGVTTVYSTYNRA